MSGMTPEQIAAIQDAMDQIIEVVKGYQAKLEGSGFSPTAAEVMAMDLHKQIIAGIGKK